MTIQVGTPDHLTALPITRKLRHMLHLRNMIVLKGDSALQTYRLEWHYIVYSTVISCQLYMLNDNIIY